MKRFNMKAAKNALDRIWSKLVKRRDNYTCQKCGATERQTEIESAHIFGRGHFSVRWSVCNGVTLCKWRCHRKWAEVKKVEFREWALARLLPEEREWLARESNVIVMVNPSFIEERQAILRGEEINLQPTGAKS